MVFPTISFGCTVMFTPNKIGNPHNLSKSEKKTFAASTQKRAGNYKYFPPASKNAKISASLSMERKKRTKKPRKHKIKAFTPLSHTSEPFNTQKIFPRFRPSKPVLPHEKNPILAMKKGIHMKLQYCTVLGHQRAQHNTARPQCLSTHFILCISCAPPPHICKVDFFPPTYGQLNQP